MPELVGEARMRSEGRGMVASTALSEARLRSGEASLSGTKVPSDARLRMAEGGAVRAQRGEPGENLAANITREAVVPAYKPPVHHVPDKKVFSNLGLFG